VSDAEMKRLCNSGIRYKAQPSAIGEEYILR